MQLLRDPESTLKDIAETIRQDQAIAVKILQLANSALYGGLSTISNLDAACARLGTRTVANAVQAVANGNLYVTGHKEFRELMRSYWVHAVATAHCANQIATAIAEPRGDALFVAGLIHDIGAVVLLDIIASTRRGVLGELHGSPELVNEVLASYSHVVGLHVVHHWKLPPLFAVTTYFHHAPDLVMSEELRTATHVVCLANAVAEASGFGVDDGKVSLVTHQSAKYLGLSDIKLAVMRADLEDAIKPLLAITGP
ncbi:MAG: HDOD domain-containing protein [Candidatus Hydrogenedentes bacterium]|nr:HDOD domain-containing protein [Candidatus Hydrogenedentota bacterium]